MKASDMEKLQLALAMALNAKVSWDEVFAATVQILFEKLDCKSVAILKNSFSGLAGAFDFPQKEEPLKNAQMFMATLATLDDTIKEYKEVFSEDEGIYMAYRLNDFGWCMLLRNTAFEDNVELAGSPIWDMLAQSFTVYQRFFNENEKLVNQLNEQKVLLNTLVNALSDVFYYKDEQGVYQEINAAACKMYNRKPEDFIGKTDEEVLGASKAKLQAMIDRQVVNARTERRYEELFQKYDGKKLFFETVKTPVFNQFDEPKGLVVLSRDISKQKEMENTLKKNADFLNVLMSLASYVVNVPVEKLDEAMEYALEFIGEYIDGDRAFVYLYDLESQMMFKTFEWFNENVTKDGMILDHLPMQGFTEEMVRKHHEGEYQLISDVSLLRGNPVLQAYLKTYSIKTRITVPLMYKERCLGFLGCDQVFHKKVWNKEDISVLQVLVEFFTNAQLRKEHEKKLMDAMNRAEAANKAKSEFLANMSHEIRTPLNGVVGMLNVLQDTELSKSQEEYLKMADDSVESLLSVINDILDYSKIEAGMLELVEESFDLEKELHKVVRMLQTKAGQKGIELIIDYDVQAMRYVIGDRMRIRQVVMNLINNAIKFTEKGCISLHVGVESVNGDQAMFKIDVRDTGVGISEDKIAVIFEQFTQVDGSSSRRYGGTGLGLSICRQLVRLMGGEISVQSIEGVGSTFSFTIVLKPCISCVEEKMVFLDLSEKRALIVDDYEINLNVLSEVLHSWNVQCDVANNGYEALKFLKEAEEKKEKYDFALIDYAMPDMDGLKLGEKIKANQYWDSLVLILISASVVGKFSKEILNQSGMVDMLAKPIEKNDLYRTICKSLGNFHKKVDENKNWQSLPSENEDKLLFDGVRILLVDDNRANRKVATVILEKLGCRVVEAEDGKTAIEQLKETSFDLVLMDVQMPVMDGFEATRRIRAMGGVLEEIPIIALTANAMEGDREKCLQEGMTDYLSKPFKKVKLIEVIERVLSSKKQLSANL